MASERQEFSFAISGVKLTEAQQALVGARAAQAAAAALSELEVLREPALALPLRITRFWIGIPAPESLRQIEEILEP